MEKLLSVVVPVYNVEAYLEKCIESIINQTYKNLEIILVDDGSTDKSGILCDKYQKQDERIKVIHKENGGLSDARNQGIDNATGNYIAFVDSDDFIHPKMYETMIGILEKEFSELIVCGIKQVTEDARIDENIKIPVKSDKTVSGAEIQHMYFEKEYARTVVVAWNKVYRKERFENIRYPKGRLHEDEFITYQITYPCKKISYLEAEFYYYVSRSTSIMGNFDERRFDLLASYIERMDFFCGRNERKLVEKFIKKYIRMYNQYKMWGLEQKQDVSTLSVKYKEKFRAEYRKCKRKMKISIVLKLEVFLYLNLGKMYFGIWKLLHD